MPNVNTIKTESVNIINLNTKNVKNGHYFKLLIISLRKLVFFSHIYRRIWNNRKQCIV